MPRVPLVPLSCHSQDSYHLHPQRTRLPLKAEKKHAQPGQKFFGRGDGGASERPSSGLSAVASEPLLPMPKTRTLEQYREETRDPAVKIVEPEVSPRSRLVEAAAGVAIRRTESLPVLKAKPKPKWLHPSPNPMGRSRPGEPFA